MEMALGGSVGRKLQRAALCGVRVPVLFRETSRLLAWFDGSTSGPAFAFG